MTLSTTERQVKRAWRAELKGSLEETLGEMIVNPEFIPLAQQLFVLDDVKTRIGHQVRANAQNTLIGNSEHYPEILRLQRDKEVDRKIPARLIKKALKEAGYDNDAITELRDKGLAVHGTYQLMDVTKRATEKALLGLLLKKNIWAKYLQQVDGISVLTASKLLYLIGDITRFSQPSKLIKYSGLAVNEEGLTQRKVSGQTCNYKPELKALLLGVIGGNFMRAGSQYRCVYDERAEKTQKTRPLWWNIDENGDKLKGKNMHPKHGYKDSVRVMVKRFLHEYWDSAWLLTGVMPPSKPYAVTILGHDMAPKIVPVNSDEGLIYSWNESGVLGKDRRILYGWKEWQDYVDSLGVDPLSSI